MAQYVAHGTGPWLERAVDLLTRRGHAMLNGTIAPELRRNAIALFESERVPEHLYAIRADERACREHGITVPPEVQGAKGAIAIRKPPAKRRDKPLERADTHKLQRVLLQAEAWFPA